MNVSVFAFLFCVHTGITLLCASISTEVMLFSSLHHDHTSAACLTIAMRKGNGKAMHLPKCSCQCNWNCDSSNVEPDDTASDRSSDSAKENQRRTATRPPWKARRVGAHRTVCGSITSSRSWSHQDNSTSPPANTPHIMQSLSSCQATTNSSTTTTGDIMLMTPRQSPDKYNQATSSPTSISIGDKAKLILSTRYTRSEAQNTASLVSPGTSISITDLIEQNKQLKEKLKRASLPTMPNNIDATHHIKHIIRSRLFHEVKFILNEEELVNTTSKNSVGGYLLNALNICEKERQRFWMTYKHIVSPVLAQQRNNISAEMRKEFVGASCIIQWSLLLLFIIPFELQKESSD